MADVKTRIWRLLDPVVDWRRTARAVREYPRFAAAWRSYRSLGGAAPAEELFPRLHDRTPTSGYDPHYLFQDVWAAQRISESNPPWHLDVGSRIDLVAFLTAIVPVTFIDIRPLEADIERLTSLAGSVLDLPFPGQSVPSLSCLHVAEHVGLGRYGDPLDPLGTQRAARELQRVLAAGGRLLFSVPVGRPRTCFNAHRIFAPAAVTAMRSGGRFICGWRYHLHQVDPGCFQQPAERLQLVWPFVKDGPHAGVHQHLHALDAGGMGDVDVRAGYRRAVLRGLGDRVDLGMD